MRGGVALHILIEFLEKFFLLVLFLQHRLHRVARLFDHAAAGIASAHSGIGGFARRVHGTGNSVAGRGGDFRSRSFHLFEFYFLSAHLNEVVLRLFRIPICRRQGRTAKQDKRQKSQS